MSCLLKSQSHHTPLSWAHLERPSFSRINYSSFSYCLRWFIHHNSAQYGIDCSRLNIDLSLALTRRGSINTSASASHYARLQHVRRRQLFTAMRLTIPFRLLLSSVGDLSSARNLCHGRPLLSCWPGLQIHLAHQLRPESTECHPFSGESASFGSHNVAGRVWRFLLSCWINVSQRSMCSPDRKESCLNRICNFDNFSATV